MISKLNYAPSFKLTDMERKNVFCKIDSNYNLKYYKIFKLVKRKFIRDPSFLLDKFILKIIAQTILYLFFKISKLKMNAFKIGEYEQEFGIFP
jgi:hypothetical protein